MSDWYRDLEPVAAARRRLGEATVREADQLVAINEQLGRLETRLLRKGIDFADQRLRGLLAVVHDFDDLVDAVRRDIRHEDCPALFNPHYENPEVAIRRRLVDIYLLDYERSIAQLLPTLLAVAGWTERFFRTILKQNSQGEIPRLNEENVRRLGIAIRRLEKIADFLRLLGVGRRLARLETSRERVYAAAGHLRDALDIRGITANTLPEPGRYLDAFVVQEDAESVDEDAAAFAKLYEPSEFRRDFETFHRGYERRRQELRSLRDDFQALLRDTFNAHYMAKQAKSLPPFCIETNTGRVLDADEVFTALAESTPDCGLLRERARRSSLHYFTADRHYPLADVPWRIYLLVPPVFFDRQGAAALAPLEEDLSENDPRLWEALKRRLADARGERLARILAREARLLEQEAQVAIPEPLRDWIAALPERDGWWQYDPSLLDEDAPAPVFRELVRAMAAAWHYAPALREIDEKFGDTPVPTAETIHELSHRLGEIHEIVSRARAALEVFQRDPVDAFPEDSLDEPIELFTAMLELEDRFREGLRLAYEEGRLNHETLSGRCLDVESLRLYDLEEVTGRLMAAASPLEVARMAARMRIDLLCWEGLHRIDKEILEHVFRRFPNPTDYWTLETGGLDEIGALLPKEQSGRWEEFRQAIGRSKAEHVLGPLLRRLDEGEVESPALEEELELRAWEETSIAAMGGPGEDALPERLRDTAAPLLLFLAEHQGETLEAVAVYTERQDRAALGRVCRLEGPLAELAPIRDRMGALERHPAWASLPTPVRHFFRGRLDDLATIDETFHSVLASAYEAGQLDQDLLPGKAILFDDGEARLVEAAPEIRKLDELTTPQACLEAMRDNPVDCLGAQGYGQLSTDYGRTVLQRFGDSAAWLETDGRAIRYLEACLRDGAPAGVTTFLEEVGRTKSKAIRQEIEERLRALGAGEADGLAEAWRAEGWRYASLPTLRNQLKDSGLAQVSNFVGGLLFTGSAKNKRVERRVEQYREAILEHLAWARGERDAPPRVPGENDTPPPT